MSTPVTSAIQEDFANDVCAEDLPEGVYDAIQAATNTDEIASILFNSGWGDQETIQDYLVGFESL